VNIPRAHRCAAVFVFAERSPWAKRQYSGAFRGGVELGRGAGSRSGRPRSISNPTGTRCGSAGRRAGHGGFVRLNLNPPVTTGQRRRTIPPLNYSLADCGFVLLPTICRCVQTLVDAIVIEEHIISGHRGDCPGEYRRILLRRTRRAEESGW
jgi:hypothetical protein